MTKIELVWPDGTPFHLRMSAATLHGVLSDEERWLVVVAACFDSALGWLFTVAPAEGMALGNLRYKPDGLSQFLAHAEALGHPIRQTLFLHWRDVRRMLETFNHWAAESQAEQMIADLEAGDFGWTAALRADPKAVKIIQQKRRDLVGKSLPGDNGHPIPSPELLELYAQARRYQREGYSQLSACEATCVEYPDLVRVAFPRAKNAAEALRSAAKRLDLTQWGQRKAMPKLGE